MRDFFGHKKRCTANLFTCSGVMTDDFRARRLGRKGLRHREDYRLEAGAIESEISVVS
jgi:hypothetical protein